MALPTSRAEVEELFADGDVSWLTRDDLVQLARSYFGMQRHARHMRRAELAEFFTDADRRPLLLDTVETRLGQASRRRADRNRAIADGLDVRRGKWRFAAIAMIDGGRQVDDVSGLKSTRGVLVRDTATKDSLAVGGLTVTAMRNRHQLPWYDIDRLPVIGGHPENAAEDTKGTEIHRLLDSIFGGPSDE